MALSFDVVESHLQNNTLELMPPRLLVSSTVTFATSSISYEEATQSFEKKEPYELTYVAWCDKAEDASSIENIWLETQNERIEVVLATKQ